MQEARPKTLRRGLIAGDGGTVNLWHEVLATVSQGCLNRARYELQGVTTMLPEQREEDEKVPSYPDHGGLNSGEDTLMAAVAEMVNAPLPKLKWLS